MSLFITINQVVNLNVPQIKKAEQPMSLIIRNSKSGALLVSKIKFNRLDWDQKYTFATSTIDNVQFILVKGKEQQAQNQQNIMGRGKIFVNKFMKTHEKKIEKQKAFEYDLTLFNEETKQKQERQIGIVKLVVEYDKHKQYEGGVVSNMNLDLKGEYQSNPKYVKFYQGKCIRLNFFSFLDEKAQGQKFKFMESIYRDFD